MSDEDTWDVSDLGDSEIFSAVDEQVGTWSGYATACWEEMCRRHDRERDALRVEVERLRARVASARAAAHREVEADRDRIARELAALDRESAASGETATRADECRAILRQLRSGWLATRADAERVVWERLESHEAAMKKIAREG